MPQSLNINPTRVLIEFVEGAGTDANMQKLLARYCVAGMKISIKDFGSGPSHLDRIITREPDIIKLNMSLLNALWPVVCPSKLCKVFLI
ncbi:MAG: EAL domain-containing protein (putative c-di-GMP-specific phosphodiesterase class I) [Zhongshania sp.]|jgi:EAL domain-containing protein (putative c-di-GMP-specific phosphodiesterase class I)